MQHHFFFLFFFSFFFFSSSSSITLPPPRQLPVQSSVWETANTKAQIASEAATPLLLSLFDTSEFRTEIASISSLQNATSEEILKAIQEIILTSSLNHNFPIVSAGSLDVNLTDMISEGFYPNLYTAILQGYIEYQQNYILGISFAEVEIMGYPPFANASYPTLEEALERPGYTCLDLWGVAGGCLFFGGASFVPSVNWVRNMTILSAVDTGIYSGCCMTPNSTTTTTTTSSPSVLPRNPRPPQQFQLPSLFTSKNEKVKGTPNNNTNIPYCHYCNCSAWDGVVGTYNYFNHLLLSNVAFWGGTLSELLLRHYNDMSILSSTGSALGGFVGYIEGDVSGAILFPESVSYLQVATSNFFGNPFVFRIQEWSNNNSWPIAWYMGPPLTAPNSTLDYSLLDLDHFVLDPFLLEHTNVSLTDQDLEQSKDAFIKLYNATGQFLEMNPTAITNTTFWSETFAALRSSVSPYLEMETRYLNSCTDLDKCFGIQTITGACICRN